MTCKTSTAIHCSHCCCVLKNENSFSFLTFFIIHVLFIFMTLAYKRFFKYLCIHSINLLKWWSQRQFSMINLNKTAKALSVFIFFFLSFPLGLHLINLFSGSFCIHEIRWYNNNIREKMKEKNNFPFIL